MLQVEQYRYPNGPPRGTCDGTGALTGLDTGGIMPGSINAATQRVEILNTPKPTLHQNNDVVMGVMVVDLSNKNDVSSSSLLSMSLV
jgi:hypothetical protein